MNKSHPEVEKHQSEKIQRFFKESYHVSFSASETEEIRLSFFFLARAMHRYHLIKKGLIKQEESV